MTPSYADIPGAATSACKVNRRVGVSINGKVAWYENGRAVKWGEVKRGVARAYDSWRIKMAERGIKVMDGLELQAANINEAFNRRRAH